MGKTCGILMLTTLCQLLAYRPSAAAAGESLAERALAIHSGVVNELEDKIQRKILDPILGPGRASAYVSLEFETKGTLRTNSREGMGTARKESSKLKESVSEAGSTTTETILSGPQSNNGVGFIPPLESTGTAAGNLLGQLPCPDVGCEKTVRASQAQSSLQEKSDRDELLALSIETKSFAVVIIHDELVQPRELAAIRKAIVASQGRRSKEAAIEFVPVPVKTAVRR